MNHKHTAVYIMSNFKNGTLYIGVTSDLVKRVYQHRTHLILDSFTAKYKLNRLVYYELHDSLMNAIQREKGMKKWNRSWKIQLIEEFNPEWDDLWPQILD